MEKDAFAALCEKLEAAHPIVQRNAVSLIFRRLGDAARMQSASGREALDRCISSSSPSVIDQSVRELCAMARSSAIPLQQAMQILQAALDSVVSGSSSVHVLVAGIGYICRLYVCDLKYPNNSFSVHPLLKALQSRDEIEADICQQVRLILIHTSHEQQDRALQFIQPLLAHGLLRSSFARQLHSTLCIIAGTQPSLGPSLLHILLQHTRSRIYKSSQDLEFLSVSILEFIDVVDALDDSERVEFATIILEMLFELWHESKTLGLASLPFISLIRRMESLPTIEDAHLACLSYFLATTELEHEQLALMALGESWIKERSSSVQALLFWVFPTLHILGSPSDPLKKAAISLLTKIDHALCDKTRYFTLRDKTWPCLQLPGRAYGLLNSLWSSNGHDTWLSCLFDTEDNSTEGWLLDLHKFLVTGVDGAKARTTDFPVLMVMITSSLIFHPATEVSLSAIEVLAAIAGKQSIWGISLIPLVLFSLKFHLRNRNSDVVTALLKAIPGLCVHPTCLPLGINLLQPMLSYKANIEIPSTGIRLIYNVWKHTERAYPYLKEVLMPNNFVDTTLETDLLLSKAISLRDVCKQDSDAGIELILSVQACIESNLDVVKALGLQGLSFLCADDAIDFYTAWRVIANIFAPLPQSPTCSESLCMLLKHGALDAAANPDEARVVANILWNFASSKYEVRTRSAAIESLCAYEVDLLKETMPSDGRHMDMLLLEANTTAKSRAEKLVTNYLDYEHRTRQRAIANDKVTSTKLGKMLEAMPRTFQGKEEFSGACLFFSSNTNASKKASEQEAEDMKRIFYTAAENMNVSGDLVMVMVSLYSWSLFMHEWLKVEARRPGSGGAVERIVKICIKASEESTPRVAENATLALAALSKFFHQAGIETPTLVSEHFEAHIAKYGHEYSQWSAGISLGLLATSFHPTDWRLKAKTIRLLVKLLKEAESSFVAASAAIGLGYSCESLTRSESSNNTEEYALLLEVSNCIVQLLTVRCLPSPSLQAITAELKREAKNSILSSTSSDRTSKSCGDDGREFWSTVGLIHALGWLAMAFSRAGKSKLVKSITEAIISWIPDSVERFENISTMAMLAGASLSVSMCIEASNRLEIVDSGLPETLLCRFGLLTPQVLDQRETTGLSKNTLLHVYRALCVGSGGLVSTTLRTGSHPLSFETISGFLENIRKGYTHLDQQVCFSAMLGFVNALGADVTSVFAREALSTSSKVAALIDKAGSKLATPLLYSNVFESVLRTMLQHIVSTSHSSEDAHLRGYARWSLGILHTTWLRGGSLPQAKSEGWSYQPVNLLNLSEQSTLRLLCEWLTCIGLTKVDVSCSATVSVMQCLQEAPRLPLLDWTGLIRRIMRHREWFTEDGHLEVRKQCILLCLRHADKVPPLANVLDEVYDISRLSTLEPGLQKLLLNYIGHVSTVFSLSRMEKLVKDVIQVVRELQVENEAHARECRIDCWRGVEKFKENYDEQLVKEFMRRLMCLSPSRLLDHNTREVIRDDKSEWCVILECLKRAKAQWLLENFKVNKDDIEKVAFVRSRLASMKIIPLSALRPVRSLLLDQTITGQWGLVREVALALRECSNEEKLEWLLDAIDTAYMSKLPAMTVYFISMLSSMWSKECYMLPADQSTVEDLPHTLRAVCKQPKFDTSLITSKVFTLLEKKEELGDYLFEIMKKTATSLREFASRDMIIRSYTRNQCLAGCRMAEYWL